MTVIAAVIALAMPGGGCQTHDCFVRVARDDCNDGMVARCIDHAARRWHVDRYLLRRRAWCESRMNPGAHNPSGAAGLFQFLPSTWRTTPYGRRNIWSPYWNSLAAAWMQHVGRGGEWVCQ